MGESLTGLPTLPDAERRWLTAQVRPVGPIDVVHERPWATVARFHDERGRTFWFKSCAQVQMFEVRLTSELASRWPSLMPEVIATSEGNGWMLLADAGTRLRDIGNPPELWIRLLPAYAELQAGEQADAEGHLARGVPDLRLDSVPRRFTDLVRGELPVDADEARRLRNLVPRVEEACQALGSFGIADTVQHDDLHMNNVFVDGDALRVLDWGDASISHPCASLVEVFRFLEEFNGLSRSDPWFRRLRDAYLEPWGQDFVPAVDLALAVGNFAHAVAWQRTRATLSGEDRSAFDEGFVALLRRALASA